MDRPPGILAGKEQDMSAPIKGCPQPDPPELVMRADGYHYQEDVMKDAQRELTDPRIRGIAVCEAGAYQDDETAAWMMSDGTMLKLARAAIAADRALNTPADRDVMLEAGHSIPQPEPQEVDMRAVCETLGFDPTNHHNAAKCPYCRQQSQPTPPAEQPEGQARTGWPEGMLQDDSRELSTALAGKPNARAEARAAAEQQGEQEPVGTALGNGFLAEIPKGLPSGTKLYTHPAPNVLATLRAEVEGLPYYRGRAWTVKRDDVLALIDKMGGKV